MLRENPQDRAAFEAAKLAGELVHTSTALCKDYVSRKSPGVVQYYTGRYGSGYTVTLPNYVSQYSFRQYWIHKARS